MWGLVFKYVCAYTQAYIQIHTPLLCVHLYKRLHTDDKMACNWAPVKMGS